MENYDRFREVQAWIDACEDDFSARLNELATQILTSEGARILRLSGPTCSGKTTLANLLKARFKEAGKNLHLISIDDFFYDKEVLHQRKNPNGTDTVDYESVHTLDLDTLSRFVNELAKTEVCHCPHFDFRLGKRTGYREIRCGAKDIFIFEGIQVLYPEIQALLSAYPSIGIYIEPKSVIIDKEEVFQPNEIRFLRRIVRDFNFRGTCPEETMNMWDNVRRNEETNIFPFAHQCELQIDSTMPYEIGILKPYLQKLLPTISEESKFRDTADRILKQLEKIEPLSDELLPEDSLYKEFV